MNPNTFDSNLLEKNRKSEADCFDPKQNKLFPNGKAFPRIEMI